MLANTPHIVSVSTCMRQLELKTINLTNVVLQQTILFACSHLSICNVQKKKKSSRLQQFKTQQATTQTSDVRSLYQD